MSALRQQFTLFLKLFVVESKEVDVKNNEHDATVDCVRKSLILNKHIAVRGQRLTSESEALLWSAFWQPNLTVFDVVVAWKQRCDSLIRRSAKVKHRKSSGLMRSSCHAVHMCLKVCFNSTYVLFFRIFWNCCGADPFFLTDFLIYTDRHHILVSVSFSIIII